VRRPEAEQRIIPTTWRAIGAGLFGELGDFVTYRMYGITGFDATGFSDHGLRGGRQKGSRALAEDWAFVARIDTTPLGGLLLGGSVYVGNSGQNQTVSAPMGAVFRVPDTLTTIWELHAQYRARGLTLRALWTQAHLQDAGQLSRVLMLEDPTLNLAQSIASEMIGGYVEGAYDVLPLMFPETTMSLEPFYRLEYIDTQHDVASGFIRNRNRQELIHVVGMQFKPHPNVVLKLDYRNIDPWTGNASDEVSLGMGLAF